MYLYSSGWCKLLVGHLKGKDRILKICLIWKARINPTIQVWIKQAPSNSIQATGKVWFGITEECKCTPVVFKSSKEQFRTKYIFMMMMMDMANTKTMTKTITNTFREHHQRAIFDNCYLWDICLELWRHVAWPTKTQRKTQIQNKDNANESKIKKSGNMGL